MDKTAYVLAIGTIKDKGAIDDIARALAKDRTDDKYSLSNTKNIKNLFESEPDLAREKYPELFYYFDGIVGCAVSQSMHPAGIVISPVTLPDNYGTFWNDGKRILSINMEEIHEVSLVKYDLLGLKNIEIIKDCCELAGIPYPKSHTLDWHDKSVWDHITDSPVGIFQMESNTAYSAMKKMGCKCIDDLSLVNAAIRPSGESYRDRLLNREWNSNPSELIDDILESSHGFLVYQEQIISFLQNVCGLSGSEADNVRRAIGRKQMDRLQAALPRILDGYCSKSDKPRAEAEEEAKQFLQIIEDSSNYMFGFNHSTGYSMIGYTCAYLRYYYPVEFITAFLNNANNDEDITNGTKLAKQLGIKIENIKFRHSLSRYTCDQNNKIIYKGLSSIKFLCDSVAEELYLLKDNQYETFIDFLIDLKKTKTNSRQLDILIKLNFFSEFGTIKMLLIETEIFDKLSDKKQISKDKIPSLGIPEYIIKKHAGKETVKQYREFDSVALIKDVCETISYPKTTLLDRINYEMEYLGYISLTVPKLADCFYYVVGISGYSGNILSLYQLKTGDTISLKVRKGVLKTNPICEKDIIRIVDTAEDFKWRKTPDGFERTTEKETVITNYSILKK